MTKRGRRHARTGASLARSVGEKGTEERLDELYREHPDGFVKGRDALAKELRSAGEREEADRIKRLRRPSVAAWLINRTALRSPGSLKDFAEASVRLEKAQSRALEGDEDAVAEWRDAAATQREAGEAVVEAAAALARDSGHSVNPQALGLAGETLQAAAVDGQLRDRVTRGRLEREQSAPTLGVPAVAPTRRAGSRAAKRSSRAQAQRELERARDDLNDAEEREGRLAESVERTGETLREEKARLAEAKRETAKLRRQVKAAECKAGD